MMPSKALRSWLLSGLALLLASCAAPVEPPRLVVVISVDQMRADYLDVFADHYEGGLRSLRENGAVFVDGHQDHALTDTAAGHATISTGVYPSRHGLVANDFFDRRAGEVVGSVADRATALVGAAGDEGSSPSRLLRQGLSDWLKAASPESKVASVSIKDRSAILLGGTAADMVFWLDLRTGHFVTSAHYLPALPGWAQEFNAAGSLAAYNGTEWKRLEEDAVYGALPWSELAGRDPAQYASLPRVIGSVDGRAKTALHP